MASCFYLDKQNRPVLSPGESANNCTGVVMLDASEYTAWLQSLANWNIDAELIAIGAGGAVLLWAAGFGVGMVISIVRKLRTP